MSTAYERGVVLAQMKRFDRAVPEFRRALVEAPDSASAHAFLSYCLVQRERDDAWVGSEAFREALSEAEEAVSLGPDQAFCHFVRGEALLRTGQLTEAEAAAREALRLNPVDADYWALLAGIAICRGRWSEVLSTTEKGLAIDPENMSCLDLRAMAMVRLGPASEAASVALRSALAADAENAMAHATWGWAHLRGGDHGRAFDHFQEALRIDPELEWARAGMMETISARNPVLRCFQRILFWMRQRSTITIGAMVLGVVLGREALSWTIGTHPSVAPFLRPIVAASTALMVWIAVPAWLMAAVFFLVFSLSRLNWFNRLPLSTDWRRAAMIISGGLLVAMAFFALVLVWPAEVWAFWYSGFLVVPLVVWHVRAQGFGHPL